jgi:mannose-6-phosphate isomerase-like protein (cupin superfamily)
MLNTVIGMNEVEVQKENDQDLRIYFNGPTDQLKSMVTGNLILMPGMSPHPPHRHPEEEFLWVTEGTGEIMCDGKTYPVAPGSVMYCAGNHLHGITNTGTVPMTFYFSKWMA